MIWVVLLILFVASQADAKNLYVNNSGSPACSDATTYAVNDTANPWCTIGRAAWGNASYAAQNASQAAAAGDTVLVTAGIYSEGTGGNTVAGGARWTVLLNPANSGTSGNLLTFRGVGDVYIRMINTIRGPMIGCSSKNYIVWDHFIIDDYYGGSVADTGPVAFHIATGCQLINSEVLGHSGSYYWGYATFNNNYRLVGIEPASFITVKNNRIHRAQDGVNPGGENEAGIMAYSMDDTIIEHNEIYDVGVGVFLKGEPVTTTMERNRIRYNLIYNANHVGVRVLDGSDNLVYQNIIKGSNAGVRIGFDDPDRTRVVNNTIYDTTSGFVPQDDNMVDTHFKNNLVVGVTSDRAIYGLTAVIGTQSMTLDRNMYYNVSPFADYDGPTYTFATWQGTYGYDLNSVNGTDPQFVNAAGGNFRIQNATALTLGRVVESIGGTNGATIPVGAYITGNEVIGLETSTSSAGVTGNIRFIGNVRIQ